MMSIGEYINMDLSKILIEISQIPEKLQTAEKLIQPFWQTKDFPLQLLSFISESSHPNSSTIHLASILLKNFILDTWREQDPPLKSHLRTELTALSVNPEVHSEIVIYIQAITLRYIINKDYPQTWPTCFEDLLEVGLENPTLLLTTLQTILKDGKEKLSRAGSRIIPFLWSVYPENKLLSTQVFEICLDNLGWADGTEDFLVNEALAETWTNWYEEFLDVLQTGDTQIKTVVLQIFTIFFRDYTGFSSGYFPRVAIPCWQLLNESVPAFLAKVVFSIEYGGNIGFEDKPSGIEGLVAELLELLMCFTSKSVLKETVNDQIFSLINTLCLYLLPAKGVEKFWEREDSFFVMEEEPDESSKLTRFYAGKLISDVIEIVPDEAVEAIVKITEEILTGGNIFLYPEEENEKNNESIELVISHFESAYSWKIKEIAVYLLGSISSDINSYNLRAKTSLTDNIEIEKILNTEIISQLLSSNYPLLIGRTLWTLARQTEISKYNFTELFDLVSPYLSEKNPLNVRLCACLNLCRIAKKVESESLTTLNSALELICGILATAEFDTLSLVIDTLLEVSNINSEAASQIPKLGTPTILTLFENHYKDSYLRPKIHSVIRYWLDLPYGNSSIIQFFVPYLTSLFQNYHLADKEALNTSSSTSESRYGQESTLILPSSLELLVYIIKKTKHSTPEMSALIDLIPNLLDILNTTQNPAYLLQGTACLRSFCAYAHIDILDSVLEDGVIETAISLLDPLKNESGALHLGYLIVNIFAKVSPRVDEDILVGCLQKIYRSKMPSIVQGLVLVYARLIHSHSNEILSFLCNHTVERKISLKVLLDKWLIHEPLIRGRYTKNATITALARLYTLKDEKLESLLVVGFNPSHSNMSSEVIAPFKILSTLIRCLENESFMPKRNQQALDVNDQFETVIEGSGMGYLGDYEDPGERLDTIEDDLDSVEDLRDDPMEAIKDDLLREIKEDYEEFEIPESKDKGLGDYETGSECLMSDMLEFDYEDADDVGEDFFEDDMYALGDWYGGMSLENFLLDFFENLIENDKEYLMRCLKYLLPEDIALFKKHFSFSEMEEEFVEQLFKLSEVFRRRWVNRKIRREVLRIEYPKCLEFKKRLSETAKVVVKKKPVRRLGGVGRKSRRVKSVGRVTGYTMKPNEFEMFNETKGFGRKWSLGPKEDNRILKIEAITPEPNTHMRQKSHIL